MDEMVRVMLRMSVFTIKDIVSKSSQPFIRLHMEQATHLHVVGFDFHALFVENKFRIIVVSVYEF
jgi:hypothetical protein